MEYDDFKLLSEGTVSKIFLTRGIYNFKDACSFVKSLPYKRNSKKDDFTLVFEEDGGTCSTKHALLKKLAHENQADHVHLMIGLFMMNAMNTPVVGHILEYYQLPGIPEAHMYLRMGNAIVDCTSSHSGSFSFIEDLFTEIEVDETQIHMYKNAFHRNEIVKWLQREPDVPYTPEIIWEIRELCIQELTKFW